MKNIWKLLTVVLLFYSLLAGMLVPSGAGIQTLSPAFLEKRGEAITLRMQAYNADYAQDVASGKLQMRIRLNKSQSVCLSNLRTDAATGDLLADITLPKGALPIDNTPLGKNKRSPFPLLEVNSPTYGYTSMQAAVSIADDGAAAADSTQFCATESYAATRGVSFPFLNILEETIRNLFYHVPMWFGMLLLMLVSAIYAVRYLRAPQNRQLDHISRSFASIGLWYGVFGILTGALWAKFTWGAWWSWDVKQNTSAVALLIYMAYFVLRSSFEDAEQQARISAIYNIFAFSTLIPLLYIVPRMVDSLHPGMGGNPAFSSYDLDSSLRLVFYPAVVGWILLGVWMATLQARLLHLEDAAQAAR